MATWVLLGVSPGEVVCHRRRHNAANFALEGFSAIESCGEAGTLYSVQNRICIKCHRGVEKDMETRFAQGLRALRQIKKLTQSELARRSGIARRTLVYWEAGESQPHIPELQAVLRGLAATTAEAASLLHSLNTPRGLRLAETERTANRGEDFAGAGLGDLLRALRLRRRMTQADLAANLRLNRQMVLRWESGQNFISAESLERLCGVLGVAPEERLALREQRLIMPQWDENEWHEVTVEEAAHLWGEMQRPHNVLAPDYRPQTPLFELQILAMKRHLHRQNRPGAETRRLLAKLETDHALWLHFQDRVPEARAGVHRAVRLVQEETVPQDFWGEMLNLAASDGYVEAVKWDAASSLHMIEEWLPRLPLGFVRTQQLCDRAFYTAMSGHKSKALVLMEQAKRSIERSGGVTDAETYYYDLTKERIQLMFGGTLELSEALMAQCPNDFQRIHIALFWTEVLLSHREWQAAAQYLTQAQEMLTPEMPARLHRLTQDYSQQL